MTDKKTEGSITRNFDVPLIDLVEGGEIKFMGKVLTARRALQHAFFNSKEQDHMNPNPDDATNRYKIGVKLCKEGPISFTPEELAQIRARTKFYWPAAQISGQIDDIIDSKESPAVKLVEKSTDKTA